MYIVARCIYSQRKVISTISMARMAMTKPHTIRTRFRWTFIPSFFRRPHSTDWELVYSFLPPCISYISGFFFLIIPAYIFMWIFFINFIYFIYTAATAEWWRLWRWRRACAKGKRRSCPILNSKSICRRGSHRNWTKCGLTSNRIGELLCGWRNVGSDSMPHTSVRGLKNTTKGTYIYIYICWFCTYELVVSCDFFILIIIWIQIFLQLKLYMYFKFNPIIKIAIISLHFTSGN